MSRRRRRSQENKDDDEDKRIDRVERLIFAPKDCHTIPGDETPLCRLKRKMAEAVEEYLPDAKRRGAQYNLEETARVVTFGDEFEAGVFSRQFCSDVREIFGIGDATRRAEHLETMSRDTAISNLVRGPQWAMDKSPQFALKSTARGTPIVGPSATLVFKTAVQAGLIDSEQACTSLDKDAEDWYWRWCAQQTLDGQQCMMIAVAAAATTTTTAVKAEEPQDDGASRPRLLWQPGNPVGWKPVKARHQWAPRAFDAAVVAFLWVVKQLYPEPTEEEEEDVVVNPFNRDVLTLIFDFLARRWTSPEGRGGSPRLECQRTKMPSIVMMAGVGWLKMRSKRSLNSHVTCCRFCRRPPLARTGDRGWAPYLDPRSPEPNYRHLCDVCANLLRVPASSVSPTGYKTRQALVTEPCSRHGYQRIQTNNSDTWYLHPDDGRCVMCIEERLASRRDEEYRLRLYLDADKLFH